MSYNTAQDSPSLSQVVLISNVIMPSTKKILPVYLDSHSMRELEAVAAEAHLTKNSFAALVLSRFADLKHEAGLHALTAIPKDLFKAPRGRPPSASGRTDPHQPALVEHMAQHPFAVEVLK